MYCATGSSRALAGALCPAFCGVAVVQHCALIADRLFESFCTIEK